MDVTSIQRSGSSFKHICLHSQNVSISLPDAQYRSNSLCVSNEHSINMLDLEISIQTTVILVFTITCLCRFGESPRKTFKFMKLHKKGLTYLLSETSIRKMVYFAQSDRRFLSVHREYLAPLITP